MHASNDTAHGLWRCPECDWRYDEAKGDASEGFQPGTPRSTSRRTGPAPTAACAPRASSSGRPAEGVAASLREAATQLVEAG